MHAIEIARHRKGSHKFLLECYFNFVVSTFNSTASVPWHLHNRWINCLTLAPRTSLFPMFFMREIVTLINLLSLAFHQLVSLGGIKLVFLGALSLGIDLVFLIIVFPTCLLWVLALCPPTSFVSYFNKGFLQH